MIKRFSAVGGLLAVLSMVLLALVGCGGGLPSNGVAKVNDVVITQDQLNARVKEISSQLQGRVPTKEQDPKAFADFERQVVEYMVTLDVIKNQAANLKVNVTAQDVQKQIDQIKQMFGGDEKKFQDALKQQNLTLPALQQNLKEQEQIKQAIAAVTKTVAISDADLQKYYDTHKSEFQVGETRKVSHILIAPKAAKAGAPTQAETDAAKAKAEKLRQEIANGADFATIAKANSDDPGSKAQGGDLGNVTKGMMVPEFDKAAFSLKKGQLSTLVKTQYGYHIIKVTDAQPAKQLTYAEAKERIRTTLLDSKKQTAWNAWLKKQKDEQKVAYKTGMEPTSTTTGTGTSAPASGTQSSSTPPTT